MTTLYLHHDCFLEHDTGAGHPERADRLRAVAKVMEHELFSDLAREEAPEADIATIAAAHPKDYVELIRKNAPQDQSIMLDGDTHMSPGTWTAVMHAVGAGNRAVDAIMTREHKNAFCAVRPPGHHAEAITPMGFCIFNSAAVAAHHARNTHGAERVAVVDFDVHHGNGTQDIFQSDANLFYASSHQMPLFPGTGAKSETGVGNIVNAPLSAGDGSDNFKDAWEDRILPAMKHFSPDILIISAGFDAHANDPLANVNLQEDDFHWITSKLAEFADSNCEGRLVSMLEGGYNLDALAKSVAVHVKVLQDAGA